MRRGRKSSTPTMETMVPSKLTDEQINARGRILARKRVEVSVLKREKKRVAQGLDSDIKALDAACETLAQEIVDGQEMLRQGDLFVSGTSTPNAGPGPEALPADQAAAALADIARAAGDAPELAPSEPHPYRAAAGSDVCETCGGEPFDPIHGAKDPIADDSDLEWMPGTSVGGATPGDGRYDFTGEEPAPAPLIVGGGTRRAVLDGAGKALLQDGDGEA